MWDTALAVIALSDGGLQGEHPALVRAAHWLLGEEVRVRGDWAVARPALDPGGWAFEFANVNYPDVDDTAEVVLALRRVGLPEDIWLAVKFVLECDYFNGRTVDVDGGLALLS